MCVPECIRFLCPGLFAFKEVGFYVAWCVFFSASAVVVFHVVVVVVVVLGGGFLA